MPESPRQPAFQQPSEYAADPNADPDTVVTVQQSPRDIALQAIEDRQDEARIAQIKEDVDGDPGAAALAARMQVAQDKAREEGIAAGKLPPLDDGAASRTPMHPDTPAAPAVPVADPLPTDLQDDPLADHIVMDKDQPMFALKVNGENILMPLDEARRRLQIGTAAEIRMQNASIREKQIDERERALTASEQALAARVEIPILPSVPEVSELSESDIRLQSRDIFNTAFSGTEEDAAEKLTKLLIATRTPQVALAPSIDEAAIVSRAAEVAVSAVTAINQDRDLVEGFSSFKDEYPGIMADAHLYNMADGMTDGIVDEHPEWSKQQVMLEAGKRTSEWVENLKGTALPDPDLAAVITENEPISEPTQPPTQIRQERKRELVPIPAAAIATQPVVEPEAEEQTPQQALDDVRRSRGQAV